MADGSVAVNSMLNNAEVYQSMGLHMEALDAYKQILASHETLDAETKQTVEDNIAELQKSAAEQEGEKDPRGLGVEDKQIEPLPEDLSSIKESLFRSDAQFDDADLSPILDDASELLATKAQVKKLIKEAKTYQDQDLLNESRDKYMAALNLLETNQAIKGKQNLIAVINSKLEALDIEDDDGVSDDELREAEELLGGVPEGSEEFDQSGKSDVQKESTAESNSFEAAVALMNDSQFEEALVQLEALLDDETYRVKAAGKMLECQTAGGSAGKAVDQLEEWLAADLFKSEQLDVIREVLGKILENKGLIKIATRVVAAQPGAQPISPSGDAPVYGAVEGAYDSDESMLDDKQFEVTDEEYSDILDTIEIKPPAEVNLEEESVGEYMEFDFIDNLSNKKNEALPSFISGTEKEDYDEFDVIDSVK